MLHRTRQLRLASPLVSVASRLPVVARFYPTSPRSEAAASLASFSIVPARTRRMLMCTPARKLR